MTDKEKAAEAKAKGNEAFKAQEFKNAIEHFSEAIKYDPTDHVFFSNRSACKASLEQYEGALEDGAECVKLKPDWPKGYTRKGLAEFFLGRYEEASSTYQAGLKLAPDDATLKEGLQKAMDAKYDLPGSGAASRGSRPGGSNGGNSGAFGGMPAFDAAGLARATAKNPKVAEYMKDSALKSKLDTIVQMASNASLQQGLLMQLMQQDPRVLEVFMAAQGIDVSTLSKDDFPEEERNTSSEPPCKKARTAGPQKKEEPAPPEDVRTPEQKEADEFKSQGNTLYKKRKFEEALDMYDKAIEKEPNDLVYYNNKCAVWIEMGVEYYDKVLKTCQDVISRRYEINTANPGGASFEKVAKVLSRMACVHEKRKDFDQAIEFYQKALTEDNSRQTRNLLRELERSKEQWEKEHYLDPVKAEEHREKGNEFFKNKEWPKAKLEYDEALRRNPKDAKLYSNRAAAFTKLLAYPDALRDLDACLEIDPSFIKAYSRKGAAHFFMKEYHKAIAAYDKGLKLEPENQECKEGRRQVLAKINETQDSDDIDEEQVRHAMADPEIQQILKDPQISLFLKTMQENPKAANEQLRKDTKTAQAISKLIAAGIVKTR